MCGRGIRESANPEGEWLTRPHVRRDGELIVAHPLETKTAGFDDDEESSAANDAAPNRAEATRTGQQASADVAPELFAVEDDRDGVYPETPDT